MVGIKIHICPSSLLFFWCKEEVEIFANFQELCEMRHGLLTGVCLNIKQSHGGLQMAGRLHSRQGLQSGPEQRGRTHLCSSMVLLGDGFTNLSPAWLSWSWPSPLHEASVVCLLWSNASSVFHDRDELNVVFALCVIFGTSLNRRILFEWDKRHTK